MGRLKSEPHSVFPEGINPFLSLGTVAPLQDLNELGNTYHRARANLDMGFGDHSTIVTRSTFCFAVKRFGDGTSIVPAESQAVIAGPTWNPAQFIGSALKESL